VETFRPPLSKPRKQTPGLADQVTFYRYSGMAATSRDNVFTCSVPEASSAKTNPAHITPA